MGSSQSPTAKMNGTSSTPGLPTTCSNSTSDPELYTFPQSKLKRRLTQSDRTPLVLVACGSFSPITVLHLQLFQMTDRQLENSTEFEVVGKFLSPCSDSYNKTSLVSAPHRLEMCNLAIKQLGVDVEVDDWETLRRDEDGHPLYSRTVDVLRHFDDAINGTLGGIEMADGTERVNARIMLLIGADLALTMGDAKLWTPADVDALLGDHFGAFVVERPHQVDINKAMAMLDKWRRNIWVVEAFENDVSSTKVRAQIKNGEDSMDLPTAVHEYIRRHGLYAS